MNLLKKITIFSFKLCEKDFMQFSQLDLINYSEQNLSLCNKFFSCPHVDRFDLRRAVPEQGHL